MNVEGFLADWVDRRASQSEESPRGTGESVQIEA